MRLVQHCFLIKKKKKKRSNIVNVSKADAMCTAIDSSVKLFGSTEECTTSLFLNGFLFLMILPIDTATTNIKNIVWL